MPAIDCQNISIFYAAPNTAFIGLKETLIQKLKGSYSETRFQALKSLNLKIEPGESVALIGHNGSGKSTLLKAMAGVIEPQEGQVKTQGLLAPLIELGAGFDHELSGLENIWLSCGLMGVPYTQIQALLPEIIAFADLGEFIHAPVKNYSSGMYMRLGFACSTAIEPDILLVDEIISVGDIAFQNKCIDRISALQKVGKTLIFVSHEEEKVRPRCPRSILLWKGEVLFDGETSQAFEQYNQLIHADKSLTV